MSKRSFSQYKSQSSQSQSGTGRKKAKVVKRTSKYVTPGADLPEVKFQETVVNSNMRGVGDALLMNGIAQNIVINSRIGNKINIKGIHYSLNISNTATNLNNATNFTANTGSDYCRVAIVWDKQSNQSLATYDEIYLTSGTIAAMPMRKRNMDNIQRFQVLAEHKFVLSAQGPNAVIVDKYISCNLSTRYDGAGTSYADITTGSLLLVFCDQNNVPGSAQTRISGSFRVNFMDA